MPRSRGPRRSSTKPARAHSLAGERADGRRMGPAANRDQIYLPPELRLNYRQSHNTRVAHGMDRHECPSETGGDHRQSPIITIAPIHGRASNALRLKYGIGVAGELAIRPVNILFAIEILDGHCVSSGKPMLARQRGHDLLPEEWHDVRQTSGSCPGMQ